MNYVEFKLSPWSFFAQFDSQTKTITLLNKIFKVFVSKKITHKHRKINIKYFIKIWRRPNKKKLIKTNETKTKKHQNKRHDKTKNILKGTMS
jgi:predicted GIY-YIG superfamily endonuclease